MVDRLQNIGFYTLNDSRAKTASIKNPLARCELILTDRCNFRCSYCRHNSGYERSKSLPYEQAEKTIRLWASEGLINVRFSGGEPTLYKRLDDLVLFTKSLGVKRIAISTNGSAKLDFYKYLIHCGVNDFSISLDDCSPEGVKKMSGGLDVWDRLINNIRELSKLTYVTVGMVFNEENVARAKESVLFAASLGVSDIRVLSSAQFNVALDELKDLPDEVLNRFPVLKYRINNFRKGRGVRGLSETDSNRCKIVLDDMAVAGTKHYPCIIALREGMEPIGEVGPNMREERQRLSELHDTHKDTICRANCLDCIIKYKNIASQTK